MLSIIKHECKVNIMLSWLEFPLKWWLKSSRGVYVWVFLPLVPNPIFYVSFFYLPKIAYIKNESTWSSFGFSKYNLCWQRKNERCNLLQKSLNCTGFSLGWCSHTSGLKICQSRPSQYLSNIESAFGVCRS